MICEHCGAALEDTPRGFSNAHSPEECFAVFRAKLVSMTNRAETAHHRAESYWNRLTESATEREKAAEAKLAERDAQIERLQPYLRHHYGCEQANTHPGYCTCGLLAAAHKETP